MGSFQTVAISPDDKFVSSSADGEAAIGMMCVSNRLRTAAWILARFPFILEVFVSEA
jgi:hypothetical protein